MIALCPVEQERQGGLNFERPKAIHAEDGSPLHRPLSD